MKHFLAAIACLPFASIAAQDTYHCEIQQQVTVGSNGKAILKSAQPVVDRKLSINRQTGEKVGNAVGHIQPEGSTKVLSSGNSANAFVATWLSPSAGGGVHLDVLRVEEFEPTPKKPFMALAGGTLYIGLCE